MTTVATTTAGYLVQLSVVQRDQAHRFVFVLHIVSSSSERTFAIRRPLSA
jgi:hypothetical protein